MLLGTVIDLAQKLKVRPEVFYVKYAQGKIQLKKAHSKYCKTERSVFHYTDQTVEDLRKMGFNF